MKILLRFSQSHFVFLYPLAVLASKSNECYSFRDNLIKQAKRRYKAFVRKQSFCVRFNDIKSDKLTWKLLWASATWGREAQSGFRGKWDFVQRAQSKILKNVKFKSDTEHWVQNIFKKSWVPQTFFPSNLFQNSHTKVKSRVQGYFNTELKGNIIFLFICNNNSAGVKMKVEDRGKSENENEMNTKVTNVRDE